MSLAPAYGVSGATIADGSLLRRDFADPAGVAVRRRGAWLPGGRNALSASWAPTVTGELGIAFSCIPGQVGVATNIAGIFSSSRVWFVQTASGGLEVKSTVETYFSIPGVFRAGEPVKIRLELGVNTQSLYIDGLPRGVNDATFSYSPIGTPFFMGNGSTTAGGIRGVIYDFRLIDPNDDTNTAYFPLDARNASGDYPNQHPGSSVGDATISGTVLPVLVNAAGGDGVPVYTRPVVVCLRRDSVQTFTGANGNLLYDNLELDPYGWGDDVTAIEVPVNNSTSLALTGRMRAKALSGSDEVEIQMNESGVGQIARQALTMGTVDKWVPFSLIAAVGDKPAGTRYAVFVAGVAATSTIEIDDVYLTAIITPSTTV